MTFLKGALRYLLLTFVLALAGIVLVLTGVFTAPDPKKMSAVTAVGMTVLLLSPVASGIWLWFQRRRALVAGRRVLAAEAERARLKAQEERQRDFLRHRFVERQRLIEAVDRHRTALERNLERAIRRNDYGALVADDTAGALAEFFASVALDTDAIPFEEASALVFEQLAFRKDEARSAGFDGDTLPSEGHDFERWVAEALGGFGWEAEVTRGSGDQGIDVLACRQGRKIGLQCKLYSGTVGNKAVQEAYAGKVFYGLETVGVLTNAPFTPSAGELAKVTGVKLFSHRDIPDLFELAFGDR